MGKCLFVQKFPNFDLKFGREVDLDELNNVIKGTFSISPSRLSYSLSKILQNSTDRLITFKPLDQSCSKSIRR